MRVPYKSLLGAAASMLMASTAMAQEHVRWNDDGTVDLMLGPDYDDTVITTTREELGTRSDQARSRWRAPRTRFQWPPKGGISGPLHAFCPVWEEFTRGKLNIVELP